MRRRLLLTLAALLATEARPGLRAAAEGAPLSIEAAVAEALARNRRLQQAGLAVETARDRERQVRALAYPQVSGSGTAAWMLSPLDFRLPAGALGNYPATGPIPTSAATIRADPGLLTTATLQLTQPLTQQVKIARRAEAAGLGREAEAERLRGRRQAIGDQTRQVGVSILAADAALAVFADNRRFLEETRRVVTRAVASNNLLRAEEMAVEARLAELDLQEAQLRDRRDAAREQLNLLLGRELAAPVRLVPLPETLPEEPDLEEARGRALTQRPEVRQARLELEQARRGLAAARADRYPEASAVVSQQWIPRLDPLPRSVGYAGIVVQWDVFDGGRRKSEVAAGTRTVEQARLGVIELEEQVRAEVAAAHRTSRQSRLALRAAELALAAEREKLRVALLAQEADQVLPREVLQQRANYESAVSRRQQAFHDAWLARASLDKALGQD